MDETPLARALKDAPDRPPEKARVAEEEFFLFHLGSLLVAVASEHVHEVTRVGALTPLPRAPSFVLGVAGHRGEVFPVIDLLRFLGIGESRATPRSRVFITHTQAHVLGFLTDQVEGLRRFSPSERQSAPAGTGHGEFVTGLIQPARPGSAPAITVLGLPRVITAARQRVVAR